ncbi:ABC transporter ATP-binding protein [Paenibacillus thermotolerans]|uniref:ABC transporter ATP-binding protein n=1 Tax=Paenibacillus thermotolerans TaxID=3027807 RepID=UPI002368C046|nr:MULTISPECIES: ABC transporter ATP-binding protein [unclassified Paenibacillus]
MILIRKFVAYYRPHIALLSLDLFAALMVTVLGLAVPFLIRDFLNNGIVNATLESVLWFGGELLAIYLGITVCTYIVGYYGHVIAIRMEMTMRRQIFAHLQKLSYSFYDNTKKGHIISRVMRDIEEIPEIAHHAPEDFLLSAVRIVGAFALLCIINWKLTLVVFGLVPFIFWFMRAYSGMMSKSVVKINESLADVTAHLEDNISGMKVVQSFANEEHETQKFEQGNQRWQTAWTGYIRHIGGFDAGVTFLTNAATLITIVAGGVFITMSEITMGDLVAYLLYISLLTQPLQTLQRFMEQYQRGMTGFRRFIELLETPPDIVDRPNAVSLNGVTGAIEFDRVSFRYSENADAVLQNISLSVLPGETVAVVGPSGAGKSTLCSLIPRYYEIEDGAIRVDDRDIREFTLQSLRRHIGVVQQDVFLFSGTVRENIAYGRLDASFDEIVEAAQAANAHDFIMSLPDGYDTYIGERGAKLSGGQKQRLSIARMFLKNPPVLILDEATSSLDNESEAIVQASIERHAKGRTTFVIAHRLATIRHAKRIIVLTARGIEEEGTHEELLALRGAYYRLYHAQHETASSVPST